MANYGVAPEEVVLVPDGTNDEQVKLQKDAYAWWDSVRTKKSMRGKYRGLTITEIYTKQILKL